MYSPVTLRIYTRTLIPTSNWQEKRPTCIVFPRKYGIQSTSLEYTLTFADGNHKRVTNLWLSHPDRHWHVNSHFPNRENNLQFCYSQAQFYIRMMMTCPKHGWDLHNDHFRGFIQTNSTNSYTHFQPTLSQNTHAPHNSKKLQSLQKLHKFHQKSHPTAIHSKRDQNVKVHHQCHRTAIKCNFQATLYWKKICQQQHPGYSVWMEEY